MERIWEVLDELATASDDRFTTLGEVIDSFYGKKVSQPYRTSEYLRIKQQLNRHKDALEFKNGKSLSAGFRYKTGFEYLFRMLEEEKMLAKKNDDERRLFLTGGLQMLLDGKTASVHLIELECVTELQNLCLVKVLAKHLGKRVISFKYMQGYENPMDITMHPHLLKEYNSRWFLFGYVVNEDSLPEIVCFSLDRIVYRKSDDIQVVRKIPFVRVPRSFYQQYFKDIVGVTKPKDGVVETISIRTTDFKVHHLLLTKPIHSSQRETLPFDETQGEGEFTIQVIPNIELQTKILSYGPGIYVTGSGSFQERLRKAVCMMVENG